MILLDVFAILLLLITFAMFLFFAIPDAALQLNRRIWGLALMWGKDPEGSFIFHYQVGPVTIFRMTPYLAKELGMEDDDEPYGIG